MKAVINVDCVHFAAPASDARKRVSRIRVGRLRVCRAKKGRDVQIPAPFLLRGFPGGLYANYSHVTLSVAEPPFWANFRRPLAPTVQGGIDL